MAKDAKEGNAKKHKCDGKISERLPWRSNVQLAHPPMVPFYDKEYTAERGHSRRSVGTVLEREGVLEARPVLFFHSEFTFPPSEVGA